MIKKIFILKKNLKLKFAKKEEIETLNQYAAEVDRMAIADKFFFEIAQIPRYEEKLKEFIIQLYQTNYMDRNILL